MQAVILAAGDGSRMRPLTLTTPKQLLEVAGKPLLQYVVEALPDYVDELVIVTGYLGEKLREYCGDKYLGKSVRYIWQKQKTGTARALQLCEPVLRNERFVILAAADDIIGAEGLRRCLAHELCIMTSESEQTEKFGVITLHEDGSVKDFVEKPKHFISNLVNTNTMVMDKRIFQYEPDPHPNGEYYLTTMVSKLAKDHKVYTEPASLWIPIATPEDLQKAADMLKYTG